MAKIASSGEAARVLLGLKTVLAHCDHKLDTNVDDVLTVVLNKPEKQLIVELILEAYA